MLKTPVIVNVLTGDSLANSQTNDIAHLTTKVPGLALGSTVVTIGTQISLRGVGTSTLDAGVNQSVSLNLDGLQLSQGLGAIQTVDLRRASLNSPRIAVVLGGRMVTCLVRIMLL